VSKCFVDKLLTILHYHLLLEDNCLPKKFYAARSLTMKLGLAYNVIHACEKGYALFRGKHADAIRCPKYYHPWYKDEAQKKFPIKVLRHFSIISRLQRMFRSPNIAKLMLWHLENRNNREGGDNLVRLLCDSKAWQYIHDRVDPTFGEDARNAHFVLATDGVNPFQQNHSTWSTWPLMLLNYNMPP
jgi:hypothetical protein